MTLIQRILRRRPASAAAVNDLSGRGGRRDDMAAGQPGEFIAGSFANQSGQRSYKIYIPTGYAGRRLPLIVMLHGCMQTPDDFAASTRMNRLAEERRCFVLYPAQTDSANHSKCWNWFRRSDQARDQGEPSIIGGITRDVLKRYPIDRRRVYVAGLSAGGAMAAVMGVTHPELYAAIGIHSGLACGSAHDPFSALAAMRGMPALTFGRQKGPTPKSPAVPTIVFHGDRDRTVHYRNGEQVISQSVGSHGASGTDVSVDRGRVPAGHSYTRTLHHDSKGRVAIEYWLVHGGGHAWFGGSPGASYSDPKGPNAAGEMVRFFLSNRLESAWRQALGWRRCQNAPP